MQTLNELRGAHTWCYTCMNNFIYFNSMYLRKSDGKELCLVDWLAVPVQVLDNAYVRSYLPPDAIQFFLWTKPINLPKLSENNSWLVVDECGYDNMITWGLLQVDSSTDIILLLPPALPCSWHFLAMYSFLFSFWKRWASRVLQLVNVHRRETIQSRVSR